MDRITSPLLAKVTRGTHLPARGNSNAAVASDFPGHAMAPASPSDGPKHTPPLSEKHAGPKQYDFVENSSPAPNNEGIAAPSGAGILSEARRATPDTEQQNGADRLKEENLPETVDDNFDHSERVVINANHGKIELKSDDREAGPAPRPTEEKEPKGLETKRASGQPEAAEGERSIKEGFLIERQYGEQGEKRIPLPRAQDIQAGHEKVFEIGRKDNKQGEKRFPMSQAQDIQPGHEEAFLIERQDGEPGKERFPMSQAQDIQPGHEKTLLIGRQDGEPEEKRFPTLQAQDFRHGLEKLKRGKRDTSDALKAIFPVENHVQKNDKQPLVGGAGKNAEDAEKGEKEKPADNEVHKYSITQGLHNNALPNKTNNPGDGPPWQGTQRERKKAGPSVEKASHGQDRRAFISDALDEDGRAIKKPVLRDAYPSRTQEVSPKEPSRRRQGTVKIGNINIHIKRSDKTENEAAWPEPPSYVDHAITEDWEWSCRYGR